MAKKAKRSKPVPAQPAHTGSAAAWTLDPARLSLPIVFAAVLALHLLLMWAVFNPTIFTGGDNGVYVALSRSLLQGEYASIHDPTHSPHTLYPPGYPAILALASLVGVGPWVPIKVLGAFFAAVGVAFTCLWARRHTTAGIALAVSVLVAMSPGILGRAQEELSDVPFWAFAMIVLWALEGLPRGDTRRTMIGGAATAVAYLTRTAAIPLVVAAVGWLVWERRWRQLAIYAAFVVPAVLGWMLWSNAQVAADLTYGAYANVFWLKDHYNPSLGAASFLDIFLRIFTNAERYGAVMIPLLLTGRREGAIALLGFGLIAFSIVGWARRVRRPGLVEVFFPLYAGMLAVLPPPWAGERYLLPIYPVALAYAGQAVVSVMTGLQPRARTLAGGTAVALIALIAAQPLAASARVGSFCRETFSRGERYACLGPAWQDYLAMADWARAALPKDAVVISRKPGLFYALSDRMGIDIPKTPDSDEYLRTAETAGARYVILDQLDALTAQYSIPVLQSYPGSFCLVRMGEVPGAAVLGIRWELPRANEPADPERQIPVSPCPEHFARAAVDP